MSRKPTGGKPGRKFGWNKVPKVEPAPDTPSNTLIPPSAPPVPPSPPQGGHTDPYVTMLWVFENMNNAHAAASTAPSPGAMAWLLTLQEDTKLRMEFYQQFTKLLPTRRELDEKARRRDTGDKAEDLIARMLGGLNERQKKRNAGELEKVEDPENASELASGGEE